MFVAAAVARFPVLARFPWPLVFFGVALVTKETDPHLGFSLQNAQVETNNHKGAQIQ